MLFLLVSCGLAAAAIIFIYNALHSSGSAAAVWSLPKFRPAADSKSQSDFHARVAALVEPCCEPALTNESTYEESALALSNFVKSGILSTRDLKRESAELLFYLHRQGASNVEGGFGVRMTVQYNLFGGSVANLGSPAQVEWLGGVLARGEIGCFALTESRAGVLSGLVVDTTALWSPDGYVLMSPEPRVDSRKTWISNGLTARWAVVISRLLLPAPHGGAPVDKGPHAFVVDMKTPGVIVTDMTRKTTFNGLDNAHIEFYNVKLPHNALLSRYSDVTPDGEYRLADPACPLSFSHFAQRLLSGRICIAGAALSVLSAALDKVEAYGKTRLMPVSATESVPLGSLPCVAELLRRVRARAAVYLVYVQYLERRFIGDPEVTGALIDLIAAAKIIVVDFVIDALTAVRKRIGAYGLQAESPFGARTDLLYVFRFAEGDSGILSQKMSKDAVRRYASPMRLAGLVARTFTSWAVSGCASVLTPHAPAAAVWHLRRQRDTALLSLVTSMMPVMRDRPAALRRWLSAHTAVERVATARGLLGVLNAVSGPMHGTAELEQFKLTCCETF